MGSKKGKKSPKKKENPIELTAYTAAEVEPLKGEYPDESVRMGYPEDELPPNPGPAGQGYSNRQMYPQGFQKREPYKPNTELTECVRYVMFAYNLIFFICGCVLLGLGIWMAVDRAFMATITGEPLYAVAIYIILAGGALIFLISFLGCAGALWENRLMIWIFFGTMVVILLVLVLGAILAIVFRTQIGEEVKKTMRETLTDYYGVDLYERKNHAITDAWDRAQEKMKCCSVTNETWSIYQESQWFAQYPWNPEDKKPYVPRSCCVRDRFHRYVNLDTCQKWDLGPPKQPGGAINRALYYEGCYEAGKRYLLENSDILIGLGVSFSFVLVFGLICAWMLLRRIP